LPPPPPALGVAPPAFVPPGVPPPPPPAGPGPNAPAPGPNAGPAGAATTAAAAGAAPAAAAPVPGGPVLTGGWSLTNRLRMWSPRPLPGQPLKAISALAIRATHATAATRDPVVPRPAIRARVVRIGKRGAERAPTTRIGQ